MVEPFRVVSSRLAYRSVYDVKLRVSKIPPSRRVVCCTKKATVGCWGCRPRAQAINIVRGEQLTCSSSVAASERPKPLPSIW